MSSEQSEVPAGQQPDAAPVAAGSHSGQSANRLPPGSGGRSAGYRAQGQFVSFRQPWKVAADGRTVFHRAAPVVFWWLWVIFAVVTVALVAIPDHDYFSAEFIVGILAVTAIVYATTLRPRVIADASGIDVVNPFRDHRIGWGGLTAVHLGDSVELSCARAGPRKDKIIYCWALYSGRRSRLRAQVRAQRSRVGLSGAASRLPADAQAISRLDPVQVMAAEIGRQSTEARLGDAPEAVLESGWAWLPLGYLLLPTAALLGLVLAR